MSKITKSDSLTMKEAKFIKGLTKGMNKGESAIYAGYSPKSSSAIATQLLNKTKISNALEKAGLTDKVLSDSLKIAMTSGLGVKATNSDSLKAIDVITKLKGYQDKTQDGPKELHQTNIYINELKQLSNDDLMAKIADIQKDINKLK